MRRRWPVLLGLPLLALAAIPGCNDCIPAVVLVDPCVGGYCEGQTYCGVDAGVSACVPRKALGETCARNAECVQNLCQDALCVVNTHPLSTACP